MPRDPKNISLSGDQRIQRRIAEAADLREPAFLRSGAGAAGAEGPEGPKGEPGEDGATWLQGSAAPTSGIGVVGDFYFRTTTNDVYYKETALLWTIIANIKGEKGETGAEGPAGSIENLDWKNSVRAATTANITIATALNSGDVLDGVTLAANDRVLVKNQTTTKENGIWVVGATPARAADADTAGDLSGGTMVYVEEGTANKRRVFKIITPGAITPGTTEHAWEALTPKDFGIVEALPSTEALKGDVCRYKAATGIYWDLLYTGEETYPWAKIGGPALHASSDVARSTTSETYASLPTDPLEITVPLAGDYDIEIAAWMVPIATTAEGNCRLSYSVGTTAAADAWCVLDQTPAAKNGISTLSKKNRFKGVAASAAVEEKAKSSFGGSSSFNYRRLWADPIRVG